jgi:hypothetical protein
MINKIKNLFLLALCVATFIGAPCDVSAQDGADKILVAGKTPFKQSEVNKLIEFYEWAFEARFTSDERQLFRELSVEYYRQDPKAARKNSDVLIEAHAKIRAEDRAAQAKMREMFNEDFVKDLRAGADLASRLLLGIYERRQNGDGGDNGEKIVEVLPSKEDLRDAEKSKPSNGSTDAQKLVGRWKHSGGLGGSDDGTGKTRYNNGNDVIFEFFADGTMRFTNDKNTLSITQCRITEITKIPGTYSVSGDQLTLNLGTGTSVGTSSCERGGNFKKSLAASSLTKKFVVKRLDSVFRPDAPLILCLDGQEDDACYERTSK